MSHADEPGQRSPVSSDAESETELPGSTSSGYWYADVPDAITSIDLLNLLREYRDANREMRVRTRESMRMGETDLVALRFLVRERAAGRMARQRDLAEALGLTAPSVSALVDRLSRDGYIRRVPHPDDRRSVGIEVLLATDDEIHKTLSRMHSDMLEAAESLTEEERSGAAKFLRGLIRAVSRME